MGKILTSILFGTAITSLHAQQKPNIVFILTDDLGYGDISSYGQDKFQTPNIDKLALNGTRYTRSYAGATVSAPSRASLLTGLHTGHTPIRGNREVQPEDKPHCPQTHILYSVCLKKLDIALEYLENGVWDILVQKETQ